MNTRKFSDGSLDFDEPELNYEIELTKEYQFNNLQRITSNLASKIV